MKRLISNSSFSNNRIEVFGSIFRNEVDDQRRKKVTTAIKTFIYKSLLFVNGFDFSFGHWLVTVGAEHGICSIIENEF